jgi:dihydrofolate reductase
MKTIALIAAVARNRAIGFRGAMPWHLPDELRHFKKVTLGKPVVMGRITHDAIGMVLPSRQNIVISRNPGYSVEGCETAASVEAAIATAKGSEVMVIGGGEIYLQALPLASRMFLTVVDVEPEADTWFPEWSEQEWVLVDSVKHEVDENHSHPFDMQEWKRQES